MTAVLATPEAYFGDPGSIQRLGAALQETGARLEGLASDLSGQVSGLVPADWSGSAAAACQQHTGSQLDLVRQVAADATTMSATMTTLSAELLAARGQFMVARAEASANGMVIDAALRVWPPPSPDPGTLARVEVVQSQVDTAKGMADGARATAGGSCRAMPGWLRLLGTILGVLPRLTLPLPKGPDVHKSESGDEPTEAEKDWEKAEAQRKAQEEAAKKAEQEGEGQVAHGEQRKDDPDRQVADPEGVVRTGDHYHDTASGHEVYVKGNDVVITDQDGNEVTRWNDQTPGETLRKLDDGTWRPAAAAAPRPYVVPPSRR